MNETHEEDYTAKDFGKDVAKSAAIAAAETVAAVALLGAIGLSIQGVQNLRARHAAKKARKES